MPAGVDIQELSGELEIKNFAVTCKVATLKALPDPDWTFTKNGVEKHIVRFLYDSPFGDCHKQWVVSLEWEAVKGASNNFEIDCTAKVGVRLCLQDGETTFGILHLEVLNTDPAQNLQRKSSDLRTFNPKDCAKNFWGWGPNKGGANTGLVTFEDVCNPSKGWLHGGTLRMSLKLQFVVEDQAIVVTSSKPKPLATLSSELEAMLHKGEHADVIIEVQAEKIRAHSVILMARSSVFASMLTLPMREATQRTVTINDLSTKAVKAMITFMYAGRIDEDLLNSDAEALGVLEAAHRYDVQSLVSLCVHSLCKRLDVETVAEWLRVADLIGNACLKTTCLDFIRLHLAEVQATESFANLVSACPAILAEILALVSPPAKRRRTSE